MFVGFVTNIRYDSSARSSVRHGCDISTFLNDLMFWTMKTIYFLNTYHLGWSSWPPGPPGSPGTPGTPEHSNHPGYSDDLDYVDHLDHLDMDYLVNLYHLDHLHRMFSTLHSPSFHSSINLTRPCRSLGPPRSHGPPGPFGPSFPTICQESCRCPIFLFRNCIVYLVWLIRISVAENWKGEWPYLNLVLAASCSPGSCCHWY